MTRIATMLATALSSITLGTSAFVDPPKTLIWNASASAPIGLYAVRPANELDVTDLVAVAVPPLIAEFMADRGYLPMGAPMMKRVLALPGQTVCRHGLDVIVGPGARFACMLYVLGYRNVALTQHDLDVESHSVTGPSRQECASP